MKLSKNLGRVATTFLATAMLASLTAVPAFAAETDVVTLTKNISKDVNAYAPNEAYTFTVLPYTRTSTDGPLIESGLSGGVFFSKEGENKVTTATITSEPKASDISKSDVTVGTVNLQIDETIFANAAPGIYRYEVKETVPEGDAAYDGMDYDGSTKYFDVYVVYDATEQKNVISNYTFVDESVESGKDDGVFDNDYTAANKTLTVEKTISGNQADPNKDYGFSLTITGEDGEKYYIVKTKNTNQTEVLTDVTSGDAATFTLKANESVTIYGLSAGDKYVVSETDYASEGYKTTIKVDNQSLGDNHTITTAAEGSMISDNSDTVVFNNYRNSSTPTGIVMNVAPYALLVVIAAAGCFVFLRKRRED